MGLEQANQDNLHILITSIADRLQVVNRSVMDPEDFQLDHYQEIKDLYDIIEAKGQLTVSETQAFIQELGNYRK